MSLHVAKPFLALAAAIMIALSSVGSAAQMAPDRMDAVAEQMALAFGLSPYDICGTGEGHDHHCPFCRLLPDTPGIHSVEIVYDLRPHDGWRQMEALRRAAQARNLNHSARAPPVLV